MKKFTFLLCILFCSVALMAGINAAERVIYSNDFSDEASLSDFEQFRSVWEIRDGALFLTEMRTMNDEIQDNHNTHIVYQADKPLTNYIVEVDMLNAQTWAGLIFNVQQEKVTNINSAFYGYAFTTSKNGRFCAFGSAGQGKWQGNINLGQTLSDVYPGVNLHLSVIVKDGVIGLNAYNIDTGRDVYSYKYNMGSSKNDGLHFGGTVGFRVLAEYEGRINEENIHFDNLVITTAEETSVDYIVDRVENVPLPDNSKNEVLYINTFDSQSDISEFKQFGGTWEVKGGRLWLTDVGSESSSLLVYNGRDELKSLSDYTLDVDMYNTQTQAGVLVRSAVNMIKGNSKCEDFYGYVAFVSFDGMKGALGYGNAKGNWGGNIKVSGDIITPGSDVHLRVELDGDFITYYISDLESGNLIFKTVQEHDTWDYGSFGFRMYNKIFTSDMPYRWLDNLSTSFDNLIISVESEGVGTEDDAEEIGMGDDFDFNEDFDYIAFEGGVTITKYLGNSSTVIVPKTILNWPVTVIGKNAFYCNNTVEQIVLPDSVTKIGENAFGKCTALSEISMPKELKTISKNAFQNCSSLKTVALPQNVRSIGENAFYGCTGLIDFTFPDLISEIGDNVFWGCEALSNVTMPASMPHIPNGMFYGCTSFSSDLFWIPSDVIAIGKEAFYGCANIDTVVLPPSVKGVDDCAFENCLNLEVVVLESFNVLFGDDVFLNTGDLSIVCHQGSNVADYAKANGFTLGYLLTCSEHTSLDSEITPATETETGLKIVYCTDCGYEVSREVLPALGNEQMDISGDGTVSLEDVLLALDILLQTLVPATSDLSGDGVFSLLDILILLKSAYQ